MSQINTSELIKKIKEKKELQGVANEVVQKALETYLKKYRILRNTFSKKESTVIIKAVRSDLRLLTGRYQKSMKRNNDSFNSTSVTKLLATHSSTAERMDHYRDLKKLIASLPVKSILDLGCGLNPLALASKKYTYYASDIKEDELEMISNYFKEKKIKGETFVHDLRSGGKNLPKADLCIMFKVLDILSKSKKDRAVLVDSLLKTIECKYFLISFSTKKLSGKKMNVPHRAWFERILASQHRQFKKTEWPNEILYLITKNF